MAKKVFTDESLQTFVDEIKSYTDDAVSTKANSSHTHSISDVTNLQTTLDGKAASSHNHAASNITSGTLSPDRLPTVPIAKGGTGATTAAAALTNLGLTATATELNYMDGVTSAVQTQLNTKAPKASPVFTGSISLGRKSGTTTGNGSVALGYQNEASGLYSLSNGSSATASGNYSQAFGSGVTASGNYSHAIGVNSVASGDNSFAAGKGSLASSENQFVIGEYNIEDASDINAFIVGNGNATTRANIHTLGKNGNAWFAGDVYVGGTSQSDGHKVYSSNNITISTSEPSGGSDGDIWIVVGS